MQTRITPIILALVALPATVGAAPLDKAACEALKTERTALLAAGLESDMTRGPEWAKANLAPERLKLIEHLIEVEEQLSFRCGEIVTARPMMKEPPKPEKPAAHGKKGVETSAGTNAAGSTEQTPAKKKRPSSATSKAKSKESAAASGTTGLP